MYSIGFKTRFQILRKSIHHFTSGAGRHFNHNVLYDPKKDYYQILGVKENSNITELKSSFYRLSLKYHPDKGGNEEEFKLINSAYDVLKSVEHKKIYDKLRKEHINEFSNKINNTILRENSKIRKQARNYQTSYSMYKKDRYYENSNHQNYSYTYQRERNFDGSNYCGEFKENFSDEKEFNERYREFIELLHHYLKASKNYEQNSVNNQRSLDKFKINIKYIPLQKEPLLPAFIFREKHKHYIYNRINNSLDKSDTFTITNDMSDDIHYLSTLKHSNRENDDETLNSRITTRHLFNYYKKIMFLFTLGSLIFLFYSHKLVTYSK